MRRSLLPGLLFCTLLLTACNKSEPLPQGERIARGTLERAELSLTRRGSHVLLMEGERMFFVETATVALYPHEGKEVELTGTFEYNSDPRALPVFVVTKVKGPNSEEKRAWSIPSLGVTFSVPKSWRGELSGSTAQFMLSGSRLPILRVLREDASALPFNFRTLTGATGSTLRLSPLIVGTRKGVVVENERQKTFAVYVDIAPSGAADLNLLAFTFRPEIGDEDEKSLFRSIVQSLTIKSSSTSVPNKTGTGSSVKAEGKPCGGPAGVLCPAGFYCQVTDTKTDIGLCKRI